MADATDGERQEAIPKGKEFMPKVSTEQLANAIKAERVGKSKSILEACLLRRSSMGIRAIAKRIRVSYSTARGWLTRMKDGDLERWFDRKRPGQKRHLDERPVHAIRRWLGGPPKPPRVSGGGVEPGHSGTVDTVEVWHHLQGAHDGAHTQRPRLLIPQT
ncbi:MAG: helix-turn-helix domain-containing protein [Thaumarchaeota archaeon]|nr:helix-turn-helix domain-containing protein [Nitrososphaerota archaeon]